MTSTEILDTATVARLLGVRVETVRQYLHRGSMPPPDLRIGRSPAWHRATITRWMADRPGRGWRRSRPR